MTRARHTLALTRLSDSNRLQEPLQNCPSVHWRPPVVLPEPTPDLSRSYRRLTLSDVYLSFAGNEAPSHPVHRAIASLSAGHRLRVAKEGDRWLIRDNTETTVGILARRFELPAGMGLTGATVHAVATWTSDRSEAEYRDRLKSDAWEVVIPELVFEPLGLS